MIKVHLPRYTMVHYYGENYLTNFEYWTTIKDETEMVVAVKNLRFQIAKGEFFTKSIGDWVHIAIDKTDLEIVRC